MLKWKLLLLSSVCFAPKVEGGNAAGGEEEQNDGDHKDDAKEQVEGKEVEEKEEEKSEEKAEGDDKEEEVEAKADDEEKEEPKADWRDKELNRKHAKLQASEQRRIEAEARADAAERLLARKAGGDKEESEEKETYTKDDVQKEAAAQRAKERYDEDCNKAASDGKKTYGETWGKAMDNLKTLGGFDPETMQQILSTDNPAQVLHELGTNPEKYQEIMDLAPAKRFAELIKTGLPAKKETKGVSKAAAPVNGLRSRTPEDNSLENAKDDEDWQKRRHAQRMKRMENRNGTRTPSYN